MSIFSNSGEIASNSIDDDGNGFVDDVNGWDFYAADNNPNPDGTAYDAHGTAVAGVVAAIGDNSTGITGVSQDAQILPVKIARYEPNAQPTPSSPLN